jgi:hypothetical protein
MPKNPLSAFLSRSYNIDAPFQKIAEAVSGMGLKFSLDKSFQLREEFFNRV